MSDETPPIEPTPTKSWWQSTAQHFVEMLPKNWQQILAALIVTALTALLSRMGIDTPVVSQKTGPAIEEAVYPTHGWVEDKTAVDAVVESINFKVFSDTPAGKVDDPLPNQVYLWEAYRKQFGRPPPEKNQGQVGSCVPFGTNNAIARTMIVAIVMAGANFEYKDICEEVTYAGSRVQVGGGRLRGDGSVGAWAAQFVQKWGVVAREKIGTNDLSTYSESRCRSWGNSGVPADLLQLAREHPVKDITQVKSWAEAKRALASGYGIAVCSDQGFSMQRDANGICRPQGSWAHCMCLDGYHTEGGKEYGHIENSWGPDAHKGPVGWGNPSTAGFWADSATIERMLKQNDSWAFSSVVGFPSKKIDWFVNAPRIRASDFRLARNMEVRSCVDYYQAF